ncbi:unnamed protein product [Amoebophrya sp. A25]|nr:unnamed protein product [Amoebophrya sp. A25]|eukprot:GSA25T00001599001.1
MSAVEAPAGEEKAKPKIKTMGPLETDRFLPMVNTYLENDFADALANFAEQYCREFRKLTNEQIATMNFETHKHRYHDLWHVYVRSIEKSLADFCHSRRIKEEELEMTIKQYEDLESDGEEAENGGKGAIDRECKRLLRGFIATTEYQSFMEFMVSYVGEIDESDGSGNEEEVC